MDPFFGLGDIGSLFGGSSSRSGFLDEMFEEPPGSSSQSGSSSGMELAPLYSSSSGHHGGRESITDILRRYQGPPRSESFGGFEDDYEENEESHVNFDAHGAHIGARVSRTQQTPFGPISCGASMQMSIGRGGVSIRTTSSSSLAGGGHGRTVLMSLSSRSQCDHSFGGMCGGLFGPLGGMFSPFGGLMPPFGGMLALGSGSFGHMSSHTMEDMFGGRDSSTDSYSGPIIEEMEEDNYTQLALTDKSDKREDEKEIDASLGLGLLASTEESDEEYTTPSTTDAEIGMILNESILVSKRSNSPVTSTYRKQTSLEEINDNIVTDEQYQNETKNNPIQRQSSSPILGLYPKNSIPQDDADTSFGEEDLSSFSGTTDMFQTNSANVVKTPTDELVEVSEIIETSLSEDDIFPSLNEETVQQDTLDTSRNMGFDMDLPEVDTEKPKEKESTFDDDSHNAIGQYSSNNFMPSTHTSSKNEVYSIFHTELGDEKINNSATQKEKMTPDIKLQTASPRNKKFTKLKFNDVKFGFGESKTLHLESEESFSRNSTERSTLQLPDKDYKNPEKENFLSNSDNKEKTKISQEVQEIVVSEKRQVILKQEEHGEHIEPGQQKQESRQEKLIEPTAQGQRDQSVELGGLGQPGEGLLDQPYYRGQPDDPSAAAEKGDTDQPNPDQVVTEQSSNLHHLIPKQNNTPVCSTLSSRRNELSTCRPNVSDLNHTREGSGAPINPTRVLPKCKHLNTHRHGCGCCHPYFYHCDDCGMHLHSPAEIAAIEAANKHEDEILDHPDWQFLKEFSVDCGTSAMSKTRKRRNKNAVPRPTSAEGLDKNAVPRPTSAEGFDKLNGYSCSDPDAESARPKSATRPELSALVESIGLTLKDVYPDGNCLFTAVVDQLRIRGDFSYTSRDLRHAAVDFLEAHPNQDDGTPLLEFLTDHERNWERYLSSMRQDGHWGDHHTIWALANVLKKKIIIYRGDKELHRTLVEPNRANREKPADQGESDQEKSKGEKEVDQEEMHLGHISESHYVSLRPADWHEQLIKILKTKKSPAIVGCNPDSKRLDADLLQLDIPNIHFNFAIKYILLSDIILSTKEIYEEPEESRNSKLSSKWKNTLEFYAPLTDKMNCKIFGHSAKATEVIKSDMAVIVFNIPMDTKVFNKRSKMAGRKDLITYSDKLKPGCTKLRTVDRTVWMGSSDEENFLRHMFFDRRIHPILSTFRNEKQILLAFQSEWPAVASEWTNRSRPYGWPSKEVVDRVVSTSGRLVPSVQQIHDNSCSDEKHGTANEQVNTSESSTYWKYVFDHAERIIVDEALTGEQLESFHIIKVFMDHVLADSKLPLSLLKNLFFYMCEETDCAAWTVDPAKCILAFLDRLYRCLKSRFVPSYFLPEVNLLEIKTERAFSEMLDRLKVALGNPFMTLYFTFEHFGQIFNLVSTLFDRLVDDARRYTSDSDIETSMRTCFIPLISDGISLLIAGKIFGTALDRCKRAALCLEAITHGSVQVSLENILTKSLYRSVPQLERWLFAFYADQVIGTDMTEVICEGQATASLSDVFGSSLDDHLRLSANSVLIPIELISLDALAGTATQLFVVLRYEIKIPIDAFNEAFSFFLKHHMPRLISYSRTKKDERLKLLVQTLLNTVLQSPFSVLEQPI